MVVSWVVENKNTVRLNEFILLPESHDKCVPRQPRPHQSFSSLHHHALLGRTVFAVTIPIPSLEGGSELSCLV